MYNGVEALGASFETTNLPPDIAVFVTLIVVVAGRITV
jgi:hypothetical protein